MGDHLGDYCRVYYTCPLKGYKEAPGSLMDAGAMSSVCFGMSSLCLGS